MASRRYGAGMRTTRWLLLAVATTAVALPAQREAATEARPQRPPNVVFVLADDLGYGELGCYGQQQIRTPQLDQLAQQGLRFTHHYAGSPVCAPSRAVLLTGRHPGHAAIRDNKEVQPEGQWPLPAGEPSLAVTLRDAGYATGAFGKWGLGPNGSSGAPRAVGFDRFFGYLCQRHAHSYFPAYLHDGEQRVPLANEPPVPGHGKLPANANTDAAGYAAFVGRDYAPTRILEQALAFVRTHRERPFFLYFPSSLPHLALQVPDADVQAYAGAFAETPYHGEHGYTPHRTPRAAYAAMITRLDRDVGALLDLLAELDLADDTIVVFTSDNGATHSPVGGTDVDFFASCGPLRGRKGSLHEGGVRVPAIVRWPGHVPAGKTSVRATGFEDWLPTLAALCGAKAPSDGDGVSFAATLRGEEQPERPFLYREFAGYGGWQAVWQGRWKLLRTKLQNPDQATTALYDLATDPSETTDVAAAHPDVLASLSAIAAREHRPSATFRLAALDAPADAAAAPKPASPATK